MHSWANVCRCCLAPDCQVSLIDKGQNNKKFHETTSIQVREDDGLPQKLCNECYSVMITAHLFRKKCINTDSDLKVQQHALMQKQQPISEELDNMEPINVDLNVGNMANKVSNHVQQIDIDLNQVDLENKKLVHEESMDIALNVDNIANKETVNVQQILVLSDDNITNDKLDDVQQTNVDVSHDDIANEKHDKVQSIDIDVSDDDIANDPVKQLEAIEKRKPTEDDEYYVLVIDESKDLPEPMQNEDNGSKTPVKNTIDAIGNTNNEVKPANSPDVTIVDDQENKDNNQLETATTMQPKPSISPNNEQSGKILCNLCRKCYNSVEILVGHMLLHVTTKLIIACPLCHRNIRRNALTRHIQDSHYNRSPRCKLCFKIFLNQKNLNRHMIIHKKKEFKCDICLRRFFQEITMQTHRLSHMHPYKCTNCDIIFKSKTALMEHRNFSKCKYKITGRVQNKVSKQEIYTNLLVHTCPMCNETFSALTAVEQHIKGSDCGKVVLKQDMEADTQRNNGKQKPCQCNICGKRFSTHAKLLMHGCSDFDGRPFSCNQCTFRFKSATHLETHKLIHTGEKKYCCSYCKKLFSLESNLLAHMCIHSDKIT